MREPYKDIVLNETTYRLSKLPVRTGSYIAWLVGTHVLPTTFEAGLTKSGAILPPRQNSLSEEDFHKLQNYCLTACGTPEVIGGVEVNKPLIHDSGRFNNPALETDIVTVLALTAHALIFNILPFFDLETMKQHG